MTQRDKLTCSLGVFAYNEAGNILALLEALTAQRLEQAEIAEVIVVSSASNDGTDELVEHFSKSHPLVRLIRQERREGKSSAINLFLQQASSNLLVVISGDVIPAKDTIEKLVAPFVNPGIGATGGRPIPVNKQDTFVGYAVHLLWRLHHRMAMITPKLGEMIAFRKVMDAIPADSAVDEASIEALVLAKGLKLRYVPSALISNRGPQDIRDFIKQRRRIQNGHLWLMKNQHHKVVSQKGGTLLWILVDEVLEYPRSLHKVLAVMLLEVYCRMLGSFDFHIKGKNPFAWDVAHSAKQTGTRGSEE